MDWNEQIEEEKEKEAKEKNDKLNNTIEDIMNKTNESYTSDWAKTLSGQLKSDANKEIPKKRKDKKEEQMEELETKKKKKKPMAALKRWFGDETSDSSDSSDDTSEWKEVDRIKASKDKRKKAKKAKDLRVQQTLDKAAHIIGIGPIKPELRKHHSDIIKDIKEATTAALKDFLGNYLAYDKNDLEELTITEIQEGKDNILYVAFDEIKDIKELRTRVIECGNEMIVTRVYTPPQIFERSRHFNLVCRDLRDKNPELKTQIRIGENDLEIFTKERMSQEPYKKVKLEDIMDINTAPKFDHSISWKRKPILPARKKIRYPSTSNKENNSKTSKDCTRTISQEMPKVKKVRTNQQDDSEDKMDSSSEC